MRTGKFIRKKELGGENYRFHRHDRGNGRLPTAPADVRGYNLRERAKDYSSRGEGLSRLGNYFVAVSVILEGLGESDRRVA